jgi:hypothetical protein
MTKLKTQGDLEATNYYDNLGWVTDKTVGCPNPDLKTISHE